MAYSVLILFGTVSILSVASSFSEYAPPPTIVNTTSGPVRGEAIVLNTNKTLVQYLGIPFAKAGRFEAPQSPTPWKYTKNTTSFGQACPQNPSSIVNSTEKDTAEDCLNLNVFIPRDKETEKGLKLSVMVWIYGGGFFVGSAAYHVYNGQYLATEGQVIVVTFNYRLGVLGFLSTGSEEIPGNFGLLDQVKALQWVQQNIERFGGNPKNVTIFGHSAGAASVALHMLSPLSYGLYHKVIIQSGSAAATLAANEKKTAKELASALAAYVGCSMSELKKCLLKKEVTEILRAQRNITGDPLSDKPLLLPVVDNHFLHDLPYNLLVNGKFNQTVPAMIGVTRNEGGFFVLPVKGVTPGIPNIDKGINQTAFDNLVRYGQHWTYNQTQKVVESVIFQYTDWVNQTDPLVRFRQKYMDVITDSLFKAPAVRSAHIFVKNKLKDTFFYCFDHVKSKFPTWAGVFHGSDLIYVFGRPFAKYNKSVSEPNQTAEIIFSKKVITFWSNFAKAGKPAPDDKWPVYTLEEEQYISLSPASSIQAKMLPEKMAFWNLLVPSLTEPQPTMVPFIPTSPVTSRPPRQAAAVADKETEYALIGVVVVLAVLLLVLLVVVWRYRRKLGDAISEPGPTTRLI